MSIIVDNRYVQMSCMIMMHTIDCKSRDANFKSHGPARTTCPGRYDRILVGNQELYAKIEALYSGRRIGGIRHARRLNRAHVRRAISSPDNGSNRLLLPVAESVGCAKTFISVRLSCHYVIVVPTA